METWEISEVSPNDVTVIRVWVRNRAATMERLDAQTVNVTVEDAELENDLVDMCGAYGMKCRLV